MRAMLREALSQSHYRISRLRAIGRHALLGRSRHPRAAAVLVPTARTAIAVVSPDLTRNGRVVIVPLSSVVGAAGFLAAILTGEHLVAQP